MRANHILIQDNASCHKNVRSDYFIDDSSTAQRIYLEVSECEKDFVSSGVFVSSDLEWNIHESNIASKAN